MKTAFSRKNLWNATPPAVKWTLGLLFSHIRPDLLLGKEFRRNLKFVRQADRWPAERAAAYQLRQLRKICSLAAKTDFYGPMFKAAGFDPRDLRTPADLRGLPTIDKNTIVANQGEMLTGPATGSDIDYTSTGGTSGRPLEFFISSSRSSIEYAYLVSSWERVGYKLGMNLAVFARPRGQAQPARAVPRVRLNFAPSFIQQFPYR